MSQRLTMKKKYRVTTIETITSHGCSNNVSADRSDGDGDGGSGLSTRVILVAAIANLFAIGFGVVHRYMAPDHKSRRPFRMSFSQISWRESLIPLGVAAGSLITGNVVDLIGRKLTILVMSLLSIVGLTIEAAQTNADVMYVGMVVSGFAAFATFSAVTLYMSEVSPAAHRGRILSLCALSVTLGELTVTLVGTALPWKWVAIFAAGFFAVSPTMLVFFPESPRWFLLKGKLEAAAESLQLFRGSVAAANEELDIIRAALPAKRGHCSAWRELAKASNMKHLALCSVLIIVQQFTGNAIFSVYRVHLRGAAGIQMNPYYINTITGLSSTIGGVVSLLLIERIGRRVLLILSMALMSFSMATYAAYFQSLEASPGSTITWLPLSCVAVHNFSFRLGLWQIPTILLVELLPTEARGVGTAVLNSFANLVGFASLKTFFYIVQGIHYTGCFFLYAGLTIGGSVFAAIFAFDTSNSVMR